MRTLLCATVLALIAAPAIAATYSRDIPASRGEELVIDLETGGAIEIRGWDNDSVSVTAEVEGRDADNVAFEAERSGDRILLRLSFLERRHRRHAGASLSIRVPSRFDIALDSSGGEIRIEGVDGRMSGETKGGELVLRRLHGTVELSTMGGDVTLSESDVDGQVKTMGGNVHLKDVVGEVEAHTKGGNVIYDNVQPGSGSGLSGNQVKITTMGGNIQAPDAPFGAHLETMGGNIHIEQAGEFVNAKTMGGNIFIGEVDGWVKATTMGGDISVTLVGSGGDVRLSSMGGEISLTVPDDLSMDVDITLAYTRNSRQDYEIESEFPIELRRSGDWDYASGDPRKHVYGTGTIGGGGTKIKIRTVNGNVRLLRGR